MQVRKTEISHIPPTVVFKSIINAELRSVHLLSLISVILCIYITSTTLAQIISRLVVLVLELETSQGVCDRKLELFKIDVLFLAHQILLNL